MMDRSVEVLGTVRPDGSLELDQEVPLPPGRVKVRLEAAESTAGQQAEALADSNVDPALTHRFQDLVREWKTATALTSSLTGMATHPAYQQIIGLGKEAVPLILEELRRAPDHWFWALKAITGEDPVPPADRGNLQRMTQAWLKWAESRRG